jgi:hypothetical protein
MGMSRKPTPSEIIDACCAATGGGADLRGFMYKRCPFHGTLVVSAYASAARRAAAVLMREQGIGLSEISEHLGYASGSGPNSLLRREASPFEQRVEREARAILKGKVAA